MNIDRVSQGVQLAANVGVILSIMFLAYQIGEQRELMKAQTRTAISSEVIGPLVSEATDEGLLARFVAATTVKSSHRTIGFDGIGYRAPTFATGKTLARTRSSARDSERRTADTWSALVGRALLVLSPRMVALWS